MYQPHRTAYRHDHDHLDGTISYQTPGMGAGRAQFLCQTIKLAKMMIDMLIHFRQRKKGPLIHALGPT